ncbi:geranylgeranyl reductase family protein [Methanolobus chelungpuianus]|uniref:geranylgeranyl diphosphate reductase n=1 Tax=Methanolobus chelungpuianus TaxID=502115 RepID=A0AAE3H9G9_9EURY|nr:geranylgeranyl reductase family protein [Methanolobus chelungpuianus]MCQ6962170.1 geranylgeranyl reductase [Methanolobus chelungpuianus]
MYDLIIVGGGPSGSAAARIAGKKGLKTLLIEKAAFPRYKPCGGALSEHAISFLDFELPGELIEREIFGARICFRDKVIERSKDYRLSVIVSRSKLDHFLLEKARETGIGVLNGEKVIDIKESEDCVTVRTAKASYESRYLILATGSQGTLKELVRKKDEKKEYGVCMVTEIPEANETIDRYISNAVELRFGVAGMGYGWIFPHERHYSVGTGGLASLLPDPRGTMKQYLQDNNFNGNYKLNGHVIPCGGYKRKLVNRRMMLVGDAAGFVDAFTGEGLAYAIRSGQIAGEVVADALASGEGPASLKGYEDKCHSEFGKHLRYSLYFASIMHRFPERAFSIFTREASVVDRFLEVVAFRMDYRQYMKWLIINFKPRWFLKRKSVEFE